MRVDSLNLVSLLTDYFSLTASLEVYHFKGSIFRFVMEILWWELGEIKTNRFPNSILQLFILVCLKCILWALYLYTSEVCLKCILNILSCASVKIIFCCSDLVWKYFQFSFYCYVWGFRTFWIIVYFLCRDFWILLIWPSWDRILVNPV